MGIRCADCGAMQLPCKCGYILPPQPISGSSFNAESLMQENATLRARIAELEERELWNIKTGIYVPKGCQALIDELRGRIAELEADNAYWKNRYNEMGTKYLDMTQQYNDVLADLEKLEAPPSEGEINAVAEAIYNSDEVETVDGQIKTFPEYMGSFANADEEIKHAHRRLAKAAITKFIELRK